MMNYLGLDRAIYDKVWNRKYFFEILIAEKLKLMLHFSATEMVLLIFLISQPIIYKSEIRLHRNALFFISSPPIYMYVWLNILGGFILQKTNFLSKKITSE